MGIPRLHPSLRKQSGFAFLQHWILPPYKNIAARSSVFLLLRISEKILFQRPRLLTTTTRTSTRLFSSGASFPSARILTESVKLHKRKKERCQCEPREPVPEEEIESGVVDYRYVRYQCG